jgi:hypothetical protein
MIEIIRTSFFVGDSVEKIIQYRMKLNCIDNRKLAYQALP